MTPEEHAAEAERLYGASDWIASDIRTVEALGAIVHALLALRPGPARPAEATVTALPQVTAVPIYVDPAQVTARGALVEATFEEERVRAFLADPDDVQRWMLALPGERANAWAADFELTDVLVLDPGATS